MKMKRWFRTVMVDRGRHILGRSGAWGKRLLVLVLVPALLLAALGVQPHVAEAQSWSCSIGLQQEPALGLNSYYYDCGPWRNSIGDSYRCLYTYTSPAGFVGCYQLLGGGEIHYFSRPRAGGQCALYTYSPLTGNQWRWGAWSWCVWEL